ncbi:MAG: N-formylglutamate amidohydrolase [Burkholderiales bacterium]
MREYILVTCEHGGNQVPLRYRPLFRGLQKSLRTHAGYDAGALRMAREMAAAFAAPLVASTVTRLLVDLNRSLGHARLHAQTVRAARHEERARIIADHYLPYRTRAENFVGKAIARGRRVVHISSHSFTPELNGKVRTADVGLLYDPARPGEVQLCERWKAALERDMPQLRVRRNYPYAGKGDGLTRHLRSRYRPAAYIGVELEINQAIAGGPPRRWNALRAAIIDALRAALASH